MVTKILTGLQRFYKHYRLFGSSGLHFVWQRNVKKAPLLSIKPKGYKFPIFLRNSTTDLEMFYYIFERMEMDAGIDFKPKVIVDGGGHIGLTAVFFAHKFPSATIYAIEPEASNFALLQKNASPYFNIVCLNRGIWNESSYLKIVDEGFGHWGFMTEKATTPSADTVEAISVDALMQKFGITDIDIFKIHEALEFGSSLFYRMQKDRQARN